LIYSLIVIFAIVLIVGHFKKAEIQLSPIFGVMVGVLYSYNDDEEGKEHWLQCCMFFVSITVIWNDPPSGLN
jgi:hypothetical protein